MKHNLLKSVILSVILLMGVSNAWGKTFYLKPNSDWKSSNAKFAICYGYENSPDQNFVEMTVVSGTDWYSADVPSSADSKNIYFMRVSSTWKVSDKWNNKWNGFGWFSYSNGSHYFTDSWDSGSKFDVGFEGGNNGIKYWKEGDANDTEWSFSGKDAQIKNLEEVTRLNLKQWFTQMYENKACWNKTTVFKYNIHRTAAAIGSYLSSGHNWEDGGSWNGGYRNPKIGNNNLDINLLENLGSGKYTMSFFYEDTKLCITSPIHKLNWTYNIVPDVKNFKVTASNVVSGTGTSVNPYVIAYGKTTTLTVSGDKASTDANSSLYAKFGNNNYSSTLTKDLTPNSTKQSVQVKAKYYNSKDDLSGAETTTQTIYYRAQTFAVNITSSGNGTVNPSGTQQVGATNVSISATPNIGYQFVNWTATDGITITSPNSESTTIKATKDGTVTANFKSQPSTTVYLKTTANWKDANARFAIYYWGANNQNGWVNMTEVDCNRDYFKGEIPYGSTGFNFVRMNPNALANNWDNDWNQTGNISVPTDSKNCFTITDDHWGEQNPTAEGTWGAFNPTLTLTLKSSTNGTYKVIYEGKTYESSLTEDVIIPNLPLNAEIYISESATPNAGYWLKERFIKLGTNEKVEATTKTTYTLCGNTTISANFVTIQPHTVYLNITNQNWASDNAKLAIYVYDETDGEGQGTWIALTQVGSSKYYTATIPKNESNFNFVRLKNNSTLNWNNKWNQTGNLAIPVTRYNTFTLTSFGNDGIDAEGKWGVGTAYSGDYRLAYVEQVVAKGEGADNWKTVINNTDPSHTPDDIIRKRANGRDTISLFINVNGDNPEVILQQYDGSKWVDREAHMVNGPLEADASMAMLPGRKNASPDSDIDDFVYDDGIDAITESGVWNFVIVQDADGKASLLLKEDDKDVTHKYTGNYYIRTDNAAGGWNKYTHPDNIMSRSTYSESGYSHYYCKWVEIAQKPNVKFIVATDYSINVSKEFAKDDYTKDDGVLVENANVRWSWDENTGVVARAYIQGAYDPDTHTRLNNIVLDYTTNGTDNPADVTLFDTGDWIYTENITVRSGATLETLTATYPSKERNDISPITQTFAEKKEMLTGMSDQDYTVRVLYDFKENETMIWLLPEKGAKTGIDVLIERVNHDAATQVAAPVTAMDKGEGEESFTVYAAISFTKAFVNGSESKDKRQFYWVSFPFNVDMKDVFGFGKYGTHWILEYYDGARRARDGWWKDSPSFWEYIIDTTNFVIEANKGYVLCLDLETMGTTSEVFQNTEKVTLYFPSKEKLTTIDQKYTMTQVVVPSYIRTDTRANRHIYDSNWNLIGVPSYANKDFTSYPTNLQYFYEYTPQDDPAKSDYTAKSANATPTFNSMYAYFVQWGGTINWETLQGENTTPQKMQAKKNADYEAKEHNLRLELQHNGAYTDQTFVALKEEGATVAFDLNLDLTKISGTCSGIYTLAGEENIQLAGNVLPLEDNTVIPVGVQVAKAGEYTFAMPDGTDGIVVELIDYETNTRTNMLLDNYTVNLGKGTFESRFALHVKPSKVTTSLEDINTNTTGVKKYLIDGVLYMQKDGVLYDAQGKLVR